jgi:hypothetical protein
MKSIEEICGENQKLRIRVELDLRHFLKHPKERKGWDIRYYRAIKNYLLDRGYMEFSYNGFYLTEEGEEIERRGWVAKRIIWLILPTIKDLLTLFK